MGRKRKRLVSDLNKKVTILIINNKQISLREKNIYIYKAKHAKLFWAKKLQIVVPEISNTPIRI